MTFAPRPRANAQEILAIDREARAEVHRRMRALGLVPGEMDEDALDKLWRECLEWAKQLASERLERAIDKARGKT